MVLGEAMTGLVCEQEGAYLLTKWCVLFGLLLVGTFRRVEVSATSLE